MGARPASDEGRLGMTGGAARACAAHPWCTNGWAALAVVSMGITSVFLADSLTTESNFTGTPESQRAIDLIEQRLNARSRCATS